MGVERTREGGRREKRAVEAKKKQRNKERYHE
jgi:hypothetical protein